MQVGCVVVNHAPNLCPVLAIDFVSVAPQVAHSRFCMPSSVQVACVVVNHAPKLCPWRASSWFPIRAAVVADKFGISRRGACSKYSLPDDPEVTRGRFCGAPLARRAIPAVGVVFSCRGAGRLFCIVLIPAVARCRHELWIPLVACTAIGSLLAGFCAGGLFNDLPRPEFVGHDVADGKGAAPPADGTFQYVVSCLQAGWLFPHRSV